MPPKSRSYQVSAAPVTMLAHLIAIAVATLVLVWLLHFEEGFSYTSANKIKILNVHTFLMIVGFILIAGEAIMAYKTVPANRKVQKAVHFILHMTALGAGIMGVYAAFKFKHEIGAKDMVTIHSWLGMCTICLFGLQWVLGFFSYVFPGAEMSSRAAYMPWHVFGGMFIFFLAICTAETGLIQRFKTLNQEGLMLNFTGLLLVLFAVGVGLSGVLPRGY
ncbi:probable ascorbate-specific transmembrane electron transporter 1 [Ricinus communis]|uniref:ascorbate ferrireductase (transmembrane) n=1 Tax=Ricinus communis TaxID=3988 RepID=B9SNH6_RICCO|nr:probable ascorbate-specific transmembrane electron transporter 1 [Ricinus communis]EEF34854.1 cytochrome B561, putative [Ricinus communis]|eukprot:XP_002527545.1 probable ascorbate-specific transmembrane electron transporter 1 [Ricinus communis]